MPCPSTNRDTFHRLITAAIGPRARLRQDPEGWPLVPARYGHLEWRGLEADIDAARVYAYVDHIRLASKLRAVPGVRPAQLGDTEAAFWVAGDDAPALRAVAALVQTRQRRAAGASKHRGVGGETRQSSNRQAAGACRSSPMVGSCLCHV
jgi:hypothetical protein